MSEPEKKLFTTDELLYQAQGNLMGIMLSLITFLQEHNIPLDEFTEYLGKKFAPGWQQPSIKEIALGMARNHAAFGQEIYTLSHTGSEATIIMSSLPDEATLQYFNVTQKDADSVWHTMEVIAHHLGCDYQYKHEGERVVETISRKQS